MNDEPKTDPKPRLPANRVHTGSPKELETALTNASATGVEQGRKGCRDEFTAHVRKTGQFQIDQDHKITGMVDAVSALTRRISAVETNRVILPMALGLSALLLVVILFGAMLWLHASHDQRMRAEAFSVRSALHL